MSKLPVVERRYLVAFSLTATLFFAWGLASQFNDLLLHHFQKALDLTRTRAMRGMISYCALCRTAA